LRPTPRNASADTRRAASAEASEPGASSEPIPQEKEEATRAAGKPYHDPKYGDPAYGYSRNRTPYPDPFPCEPPSEQESLALNLTPAQRIAIELLLLGSQLSVVAKKAGVTRMTLYRWLNYDANFQAAYHTWQADAVINMRTRVLSMAKRRNR
jgi:hypothetical protein